MRGAVDGARGGGLPRGGDLLRGRGARLGARELRLRVYRRLRRFESVRARVPGCFLAGMVKITSEYFRPLVELFFCLLEHITLICLAQN